jgi:hypothetical protein
MMISFRKKNNQFSSHKNSGCDLKNLKSTYVLSSKPKALTTLELLQSNELFPQF